MLLDELLREPRGARRCELRLGSLGSPEARAAYREELRAYLRAHEAELAEDVRERIDDNPLRAFDSKDEGTRAVMAEAPTMLDRLDGEDAEHFAEVRRAARRRPGSPTSSTATLVRGLDYYTRTVFAFECERLGRPVGDRRRRPLRRPDRAARRPADPGGGLGGGRRADPAGARRASDETPPRDVFVAAAGRRSASARFALVTELRRAGPARRARPRRPRRSRAR